MLFEQQPPHQVAQCIAAFGRGPVLDSQRNLRRRHIGLKAVKRLGRIGGKIKRCLFFFEREIKARLFALVLIFKPLRYGLVILYEIVFSAHGESCRSGRFRFHRRRRRGRRRRYGEHRRLRNGGFRRSAIAVAVAIDNGFERRKRFGFVEIQFDRSRDLRFRALLIAGRWPPSGRRIHKVVSETFSGTRRQLVQGALA